MALKRTGNLAAVSAGRLQAPGRNLLANGCMRIWQRGTPLISTSTFPNSDDSYIADRWILLSDGNDRADMSQETSIVPSGAYASMKFEGETLTPGEKFGILQIVEARNAAAIIGKNATLSFEARTTSGQVENLRAAILAWDSTADTVTSDVVSAWNAEGSNPTLVANWTYENTPGNLALGNTFRRFTVSAVPIDTASTTNVAVFIWVDDTDVVANDVLYIGNVKLEVGNVATPFEFVPVEEELRRCQRYFCKTFDQSVEPAQSSADFNGAVTCPNDSAGTGGISWVFPTIMRSAPTVVTYNPTQANANWRQADDGGDGTVGTTDPGEANVHIPITGASLEPYRIHATAVAEL